jgi:hypothetical protein
VKKTSAQSKIGDDRCYGNLQAFKPAGLTVNIFISLFSIDSFADLSHEHLE